MFSNHGPALPYVVPYCETLIKIVPRLMTQAGTNSDSVGCVMDALKVEGWYLNLKQIMVVLKTNSTMLKRKKIKPMV